MLYTLISNEAVKPYATACHAAVERGTDRHTRFRLHVQLHMQCSRLHPQLLYICRATRHLGFTLWTWSACGSRSSSWLPRTTVQRFRSLIGHSELPILPLVRYARLSDEGCARTRHLPLLHPSASHHSAVAVAGSVAEAVAAGAPSLSRCSSS